MITKNIKTETSSVENMLNYCTVKQKVASRNIANVTTEGYKREDVAFKNLLEGEMASSLKVANPKHIPFGGQSEMDKGFEIIQDNGTEMFSGVNNVDMDREMTELAENSIRYKLASKKISGYFKNLQMVIKGQ